MRWRAGGRAAGRTSLLVAVSLVASGLTVAAVTVVGSVVGHLPAAGASGGPAVPAPIGVAPPALDPVLPVYATERYGPSIDYEIPEPPGLYMVHLVEADTYWTKPSQRVFSVFADGMPVITNLDMIGELGGVQGADDHWFTSVVLGSTLSVVFTSTIDNASVRGIEVFPLSGTQTQVVRIDAGSTVAVTDAAGNVWAADEDVTGGSSGGATLPAVGAPYISTPGAWVGPAATYAYAWQRCDTQVHPACAAIPGATSNVYAASPVDLGFELRSQVTATNSGGSASQVSVPSAAVTQGEVSAVGPPLESGPPVVTGNAAVGSVLTAATGGWRAVQPSFSYAWSQCNSSGGSCTPISGATSATYTPASGDLGHTLTAEVTVTTVTGSSSAVSPASAVVAAAGAPEPSVAPTAVVVPGTQVYQASRYGTFSYTVPVSNGTYSIRLLMAEQGFQSSGSRVFDVVAQGNEVLGGVDLYREAGYYVSDDKTFTAVVTNGSLKISFVAGVDNPTLNGLAIQSISNPSAAPVLIAAGATGSYVDALGRTWVADTDFSGGNTSATNGTTTQHLPFYGATTGTWSGSPTSFTYQWERCNSLGNNCAAISGATSQTYATATADVASTLRAQVTAVGAGGSTTITTAASAVVVGNLLLATPVSTAPPVISGTGLVGAKEAGSLGGWSGILGGFTYQWQRCDTSGNNCTAISGATSRTYTTASADAAHTLRLIVSAASPTQAATATSAQTVTIAQPPLPVNVTLPVVTGGNQSGVKLTTSTGGWLNVPTSYSYKWERCDTSGNNCTIISGATSSTYTQATADVGHTLRSQVTATNGGGSSPAATSTQTALVASTSSPKNTAVPTVSGSATVGSALTTTNGTWSNSPTSYAYAWQRCDTTGANCAPISGATASSYTLVAADAAHTIRSQVTATNASGSVFAWSTQTAVVVVSGAPALTTAPGAPSAAVASGVYSTNRYGGFSYAIPVPASGVYQIRLLLDEVYGTTVDGNIFDVTAQGQTVVSAVDVFGDTGGYDITDDKTFSASVAGTTLSLGFPPDRGGDELTGIQVTSITNPTMTPIRIDVGSSTSYTDPQGNLWAADEYYTGGGTGTGGNATDPDGPLTVGTGTWTNSPTSYAYQWQRCDLAGTNCAAISGATTNTYTPTTADVGSKLEVAVTATNSHGSTTGLSGVTSAIALLPPTLVDPPSVTGPTVVGYALTAATGGWTTEPAAFTFQWQRCDTNGANCTAISGATASTYTEATADVGHTTNVIITDTTTSDGTASATSPASAVVAAATGAPVALSGDQVLAEPGAGNPTTGQGLYYTTRYGTFTVTVPLANGSYIVRLPLIEQFDNGAGLRQFDVAADGTLALSHIDIWSEAGFYVSDDKYVPVTVTNGTLTLSFVAEADTATAAGVEIISLTNPAMAPVRIDLGSSSPYTDDIGDVWSADTSYVSGGATANVTNPITDQGWTLGVTPPSWANTPTSFTYQWERCDQLGNNCTPIGGATAAVYTTGRADYAATLRQQITATNSSGNTTVTSPATALVSSYPTITAPVNVAPPSVNGGPLVVGSTATTTTGVWTTSGKGIAITWQSCDATGANCTAISGQAASTYTTQPSDAGRTIRSAMTYATTTGATTVTSGATPVSAQPTPVSLIPPAVTSLAQQGESLSADTGGWQWSASADVTAWLRCDANGANCTQISTSSFYTPVAADVGHTIEVQVTAGDPTGNTVATSGPSNVVVAPPAAPSAPTNVAATLAGGSVLLAWTPPTSTGNDPLVSQTVIATVNGVAQAPVALSGLATSAKIDSIPTGVPVTFTVQSDTAYFNGATSAASTAVTLSAPNPTTGSPEDLNVSVGYADALHTGVAFYPSPWASSPNVNFAGTTSDPNPDAGAIRFHNPTSSAITISNLQVTIGTSATYNLWGSDNLTVAPNSDLIATETATQNFDTSDANGVANCVPSGAIPQVSFTVNGTSLTLSDTGQVLNTGGVDYADCASSGTVSEGIDWQPIGICGTPAANMGQSNAAAPSCDDHQGDPVDTHSGNFTESAADLSLPGIGPGLSVTRTYNSSTATSTSSGADGMFGFGWSSNLTARLLAAPSSSTTQAMSYIDEQGNGASFAPDQTDTDPNYLIGMEGTSSGQTLQFPYTHQPEVRAELTDNISIGANGGTPTVSYQLIRNRNQIFTFSPSDTNAKCAAFVPLSAVADLNGYSTSYTYDTSGRLIKMQDNFTNRTFTLAYTNTGVNYCHVSSITDATLGRTVSYSYDSFGDLSQVTDAYGGVTKYGYTTSHQLNMITNPRQSLLGSNAVDTTIHYNAVGQVNEIDAPAWNSSQSVVFNVTTYTYVGADVTTVGITGETNDTIVDTYTNGQLFQQTLGNGQVTRNYYYTAFQADAQGVPYSKRNDSSVVLLGHVTTSGAGDLNTNDVYYSYDLNGNVSYVTDGVNDTQSATYNLETNALTSRTDGNGVTTSYTLDPLGVNVTQISTPLVPEGGNQVTQYVYTGLPGQPTEIIDPDNNTWNLGYDANGDLTSRQSPLGNIELYCYNFASQLTATVAPQGVTAGVTCASQFPAAFSTNYAYDALGRQTLAEDAAVHKTTKLYDLDGNLEQVTDASGYGPTYMYDPSEQLSETTRADSSILKNTFNSDGTLATSTDGATNPTNYVYDGLKRLTSITDPNSQQTTYTYDAAGNVLTRTDPDHGANSAKYTYDNASELTNITYRGDTPNTVINYTAYNKDHQPLTMTDPTGTNSWGWDSLGRLVLSSTPASTVHYGYDARGSLTSMTYPNGELVSYTPDQDGRLKQISDGLPTAHLTNYTYTSTATAATVTAALGNGVTGATTVTSAGALQSVTNTLGTSTFAGWTYNTYPNNLLQSETPVTGSIGTAESYTYSLLNQLKTVSSNTLTYDGADNLTTTDYNTTQAFNPADELCWTATTSGTCGSPPTGAITYSHDNRGDRTQASTTPATVYSWNQAGELTSVTGPNPTSYTYSGDGLRYSKTYNSHTATYSWDKASSTPLLLTDGTNNWIYGPDGYPIEQVTGTGQSATATYYSHDAQGSTREITNQSGAPLTTANYDDYGRLTSGTQPTLGYAGQSTDEDGLIYLRARYYDPTNGQLLSKDPAGSSDPFTYAANSPTNASDPSGLRPWWQWALAGVAIGVGAVLLCTSIIGCAVPLYTAIATAGVGDAAVGGAVVGAGIATAGDLGDQESAQLGAEEAGAGLPKLTGTIAESFSGGDYSEVGFHAGDTFVRAEAWSATSPGSFLGLESVDTSAEAEQAYNLAKWGNPAEVQRTYALTQDLTMYYGEVAGGEGYQALIPRGVDPADVLRLISERPLP